MTYERIIEVASKASTTPQLASVESPLVLEVVQVINDLGYDIVPRNATA